MQDTNSKPKICLIGSSVFTKMDKNGCFDGMESVGQIVSLNPVSLYTISDCDVSSKQTEIELDYSKTFQSYLRGISADFLFVNLENVKRTFYYWQDNYYTDNTFLFYDLAKKEKYKSIEPTKIGYRFGEYPSQMDIILKGVKRFAEEVARVFPPDRIVLMACVAPKYCVTANNLVANSWFVKYNEFLKKIESVFSETSGCFVWEFPSNCCPIQKYSGRQLAANDFYPAFFQEAKEMIALLTEGKKEEANVPSFRFFVDLYKKFETDLINRKNFRLLVDPIKNEAIDFLINTSVATVEADYPFFERW